MNTDRLNILFTLCLSFSILTVMFGCYQLTHNYILSIILSVIVLVIFGGIIIPRELNKRYDIERQNLREEKQ